MKRLISAAPALLVLGLTGCPDVSPTAPGTTSFARVAAAVGNSGDAASLKLHPSGFGRRSYAAWKAQEGQQDREGDGDHSLYFQKMVPTPVVAAGVAIIRGLEEQPASVITGLSWQHRTDGHCGGGAPRWNIAVRDRSGHRFTVFLGCAAAVHGPVFLDERGRPWIQDSYPAPAAEILAQTGAAAISDLTITGLAIVFDEGNDVGQGFVHLDNITVAVNGQSKVFTGPMDNGNTP
jgi:hypothetical protein